MALSASIALGSASPIPREQKLRVVVTVSNSSGADISLDQIVPSIKVTNQDIVNDASSDAKGKCIIDPSNPVPAGGSAIFVFDVALHTSSLASTFDIGCTVFGNGEVVVPTPVTIQVI
jgi:hypothetical protein